MILSSAEVHRALDQKRLIITPEPAPRVPSVGGDHCPYDTHSVDLRLASEISVPLPGNFAYNLRPERLAAFIASQSTKYNLTERQPFLLRPNEIVLGKPWSELSCRFWKNTIRALPPE